MVGAPNSLAIERLERLLAERNTSFGRPLEAMASTASTMDDAMAAARGGAPQGATFLAECQTRGRGRRGRGWTSRPGQSLMFSVVLRPPLAPPLAPMLALVAGLAVRRVVADHGVARVRIKWPNDVLVDCRKIAGVLVESQVRGPRLEAVVVGIGLNVTTLDFDSELRERATSLALAGADRLDRVEVLVELLTELERRLAAPSEAQLAQATAELSRHDALNGVALRVGSVTGVGAGIDATGALLVADAAGTTHAVTAGSVILV